MFLGRLGGVLLVCLSLLSVNISQLAAQSSNAQLTVETLDPSGAAMQANGLLLSGKAGGERRFSTDHRGLFVFSHLAPGQYRLRVSEPGFAEQTLEVSLAAGDRKQETVKLALRAQATSIQVVGTTPLSSNDESTSQLARPAQAAGKLDILNSGSVNLADFLNKRLNSVYINETQGNPFQPDLNYRGYTASPLLGASQGLSVFMDGVRLNQPFGDVVSWDLIPKVAISEVTLIPGSDPLYGLNTLGGAISLTTKDGLKNPGTTLELSGGSFGRKAAEVEHGGFILPSLNYYVAANLFFEDGWRAASPSNIRQFFGKLNWQGARTDLGFSVAYANNSLIGNGLGEQRFLLRDYRSIYTKPDITSNRSPFVNFKARHSFTSALEFSGNAYYRNIATRTLNGDLNDDSLDQSIYALSAADQRALRAAGYSGFPASEVNATVTPFPKWRCIAQALENDEPAEKCNGLLNTTVSSQKNYGVFGQLNWTASPGGRKNRFLMGGGYDGSSTSFSQLSQLGYLNPDRSVTPVNAFGDGLTGGDVDGARYDTRVNLRSRVNTGSFYFADTFQAFRSFTVNVSGRYNHTSVRNRDLILTGGGPGSLTGDNTFERLNPSVGITYSPFRLLGGYASYSESSRAPTSIELGCADPATPCKLPNAFAGDPPLKQVVTRTWEAGLRGGQESRFGWSAGWFRSDNRNDLLFVSSTQTGFGYFRNFGRTLRQGAEVSARARVERVTFGAGYTFLDATYQSAETLDGSGNSANDEAIEGEPGVEGTIRIRPGNQIPLSPRHLMKAYADLQITSRLSVSLNEVAVSKSFARGNENNLSTVAPPYYIGPGYAPGYALLNVGARYRATKWAEAFVQINNVFNRRYFTAALLGATGFTADGSFVARPFPGRNGEFPLQYATFYAPGAPVGVWGGIRFRF